MDSQQLGLRSRRENSTRKRENRLIESPLGKGGELDRHYPAGNSTGGVDSGSDRKAFLLPAVGLFKHSHVTLGGLNQPGRGPGEEDAAFVNDDQLVTDRLYILNDMGGEKDDFILGNAGKQVAEVDPFLRVQADSGLVKDQEGGIP